MAAVCFALLFCALFLVRMGVFTPKAKQHQAGALTAAENFSDKNTWMNILQNGNKIGFSHASYVRARDGLRFSETVFMRINTMGLVQDISLKSNGQLNEDFSLSSFTYEVSSGRFDFIARGTVNGNALTLDVGAKGSQQTVEIPLGEKIYFTSGIVQAASAGNLHPGESVTLKVFDPVAMGQESITLTVLEKEEIVLPGRTVEATKISLRFKGSTQLAWIDAHGNILKETGMLGISLVNTTQEDAMSRLPVKSSQDLTDLASVPANRKISDPAALQRFKARITGLTGEKVRLNGGRQAFADGVLTIRKESLDNLPTAFAWKMRRWSKHPFLQPSPFIQSNHPAIVKLANDITGEDDSALEKSRKIMAWIQKHIRKRPVLSLPDAVSTLENRVGDCNEHAVLFAALARAVYLPTKVEAGLVYLNGRFYYHAWNLVDLGRERWITADALFNQLPADVTHIRLAGGAQEDQLNILGLIGKIGITILEGTE